MSISCRFGMDDGGRVEVNAIALSLTGALLGCREPLTMGVGGELGRPGAAVKCRITKSRSDNRHVVSLDPTEGRVNDRLVALVERGISGRAA